MDDLDQFDLLLTRTVAGEDETHGYLVSWEGTESEPFALVVEDQTVPSSVGSGSQEDENYGFRDLQDTWRLSFSNFTGGEGQRRRDVTGGSIAKYWKSLLVDTSAEGDVKLHRNLRLFVEPWYTERMDPSSIVVEHKGRVYWAMTPLVSASVSAHMQVAGYDPQTGDFYLHGEEGGGTPCWVSAMCSDGYYLYVAYVGGTDTNKQGIYRYSDGSVLGERLSSLADAPSKMIDRMCYAGGYLYLSCAGQVGYLSSTTDGAFTQINAAAIIKPNLSCFGMVSSGPWVYWGVRGAGRSYVYRVQYAPSEDVTLKFEQYLELPSGFVGTTLVSYLSMLFVAGYYPSQVADAAQGVVYLASDNGIAMLTRIGDDPNEVQSPGDSYKNQIVAGAAYDHWLYLLTERSLYRWDLRAGGLNHVGEVGTFRASAGRPGHLVDIPWNTTLGCWPGYANSVVPWAEDILPQVQSQNFPAKAVSTAVSDQHGYLATHWKSSTANKAGSTVYTHRFAGGANADTHGDFSQGGCIEAMASGFDGHCLELGVGTASRLAQISFYGDPGGDKVRVYYYNASGGNTLGAEFGGWNAEHDFFLSCDPVSGLGRLWIDGGLAVEWPMPVSSYEPLCSYTLGAHKMNVFITNQVNTHAMDWSVTLRHLRWASGSGTYYPNWQGAAGTVGASSFCVAGGTPYIPCCPNAGGSGSGNGLMQIASPDSESPPRWDTYPAWIESDPRRQIAGELWTSESAARMPTVPKYVVALDVYHEPLGPGEGITVTPVIDGKDVIPFAITQENGGAVHMSTANLVGASGTSAYLKVQLTGPGATTPVFHGASLRFSPVDNSYYIFRLDLRAERRDKTNFPTDTAADILFLKELAESKATVTLQTPLETCQVRVSAMQFIAAQATKGSGVNPHGFAVIKLKRVP